MQFLKNLLFNLFLFAAIGVVLYFAFPDLMREIFVVYGNIFKPALIILLIIASALPRKNRN